MELREAMNEMARAAGVSEVTVESWAPRWLDRRGSRVTRCVGGYDQSSLRMPSLERMIVDL